MFTKDLQLKAFKEASLPSIAITTVRRFLVLAVAMVHVIQVVCSQLKLTKFTFFVVSHEHRIKHLNYSLNRIFIRPKVKRIMT